MMDKATTHAAVRVLQKMRRVMNDLLMTEELKSSLIQYGVFPEKTIEELFLVTA